MQIKFGLKLCVYSLGVDIWLLSFKFNFGLMCRPLQPPRERVLKINKIVDFWWSISHWETKKGLFGAMVDGNIKLSNLFCEMRLLRSLRSLRLLRPLRPQIFQGLKKHYWALQIFLPTPLSPWLRLWLLFFKSSYFLCNKTFSIDCFDWYIGHFLWIDIKKPIFFHSNAKYWQEKINKKVFILNIFKFEIMPFLVCAK